MARIYSITTAVNNFVVLRFNYDKKLDQRATVHFIVNPE